MPGFVAPMHEPKKESIAEIVYQYLFGGGLRGAESQAWQQRQRGQEGIYAAPKPTLLSTINQFLPFYQQRTGEEPWFGEKTPIEAASWLDPDMFNLMPMLIKAGALMGGPKKIGKELIEEMAEKQLTSPPESPKLLGMMEKKGAGEISAKKLLFPEGGKQILKDVLKDENGNPLVLYHGTDQPISEFIKGDIGFHFGTLRQAENRLSKKFGKETVGQNILPVYLRIKNPLKLVADPGSFDHPYTLLSVIKIQDTVGLDFINKEKTLRLREITRLNQKYKKGRYLDSPFKSDDPNIQKEYSDALDELDHRTIKKIRNELKKKGYDGLVYYNAHEGFGESYVAFDSNQVISTITNQPFKSSLPKPSPPAKD